MTQKKSIPVRDRNRHTSCAAVELCAGLLWELDTDVSRMIASSLTTGLHNVAIGVQCNPLDYTNLDLFWRDWCAVNLVKKLPTLNLGIDTKAEALVAFHAAERSCALINANLPAAVRQPSIGLTTASYLHTARNKIASVVGDFDWATAEAYFTFSGGASTRLPRKKGSPYYKYSGKPEVTLTALPLAMTVVKRTPLWRRSMVEAFGEDARDWFKVVLGSRITTVPKSAKTDRTIAIEPCMNMLLQKGIGGMLRKRLKRVGVDLDDQTHNQRMARTGSLDGSLATIDLSAASDSISMELVRLLMPPSWLDAIEMTRCERGSIDNDVVVFEKVSSMGNGFTFELESLIFWALTESVLLLHGHSDRRIAVYGDDIVVATDAVPSLIDLLNSVGFSTNADKSFWSGPFRESCGKHYFHGVDVTPIYVKEPIDTDVRLLWYANSIRRWASRPTFPVCDPRFIGSYVRAVRRITPSNRVFIPDGAGDGGLIGTFDEACPSYSRRKACFSLEVLSEVVQKWRPDGPAAVLTYFQGVPVAYGASRSERSTVVQLCTPVGRYVKSKMYLSEWAETPYFGDPCFVLAEAITLSSPLL